MLTKNQQLIEKWSPILNAPGAAEIKDPVKLATTATLLENQEIALNEERRNGNDLLMEGPTTTNVTGSNISNWDPVLISMVRRSTPNMVAFDIAGVQPMTGPVGLIFCMKSRYVDGSPRTLSTDSTEALYNEADTSFSGTGSHAGDPSSLPTADNSYAGSPEAWSNDDDIDLNTIGDSFSSGTGMATATGEALDSTADHGDSNYLEEMGFTIEKTSVTATTRALRAEYSVELAQDLKAIHGLDAEAELANILSTEIMSEINREFIRTINRKAKLGAQHSGLTNTLNSGPGGIFDLSSDADGRWSVEKYRGLLMQIERERNVIAKETRRGRGNWILCSSDVAAALNAAGILDYGSAGTNSLSVDDTGNTFAGVISGQVKVYIDPYASTVDYCTVGYKGQSPMDAGIFYCPYVPLTPFKSMHSQKFQPTIAFKSRQAMASNPFAEDTPVSGTGTDRSNKYFRIFAIKNIL